MTGWPLSTMILQLGHTYIKLFLSRRDRVADIKHTSEALGILLIFHAPWQDSVSNCNSTSSIFSRPLGYLNPSLSCQVRSSFSQEETQERNGNSGNKIITSLLEKTLLQAWKLCHVQPAKKPCKSRGSILSLWDPSPWAGTETDQWVDIVGSSSTTTL